MFLMFNLNAHKEIHVLNIELICDHDINYILKINVFEYFNK